MSRSNPKREIPQNEEIKAVSLEEILFLFVAFGFILYLLFPKETLKEKVFKETKSNDLAIVYIENMIKFDQNNYALLFHFANIHFKEGHFKAVKSLVQTLLKSDLPYIRKEALLLGEKLFKREYFLLKKPKEREKLLKEYQCMLEDMILVSEDEQFQNDILTYFAQSKEKNKYSQVLKKLAKTDPKWEERLAEYYTAHQQLKPALAHYLKLLQESHSYQKQKELFLETLTLLMYGSYFKEGKKIVTHYEDRFLQDDQVFEKILRFYLAAGEEKKARKYILKRKNF